MAFCTLFVQILGKASMQSFISETLDDILKSQQTFENSVFILPSQRAGVFLKKALQEKIRNGFLPEILSIENFIARVSEIDKIDAVPLLFNFYSCYKKHTPSPETFDVFASWAVTALQDFNEIDQHLVDAKSIFNYLKDIQRIKNWDLKIPMHSTPLMKNHFSFMEKLGLYYSELYEHLITQKLGYQGLMYREAAKKISSFTQANSEKSFIFLGFNALNKAEEFIFQTLLESDKSKVYWDIDSAFLKDKHQAGYFIRNYKNSWKYYEKNELKTVSNSFNSPKNIQVIGAAKNSSQLKYVGELLESFESYQQTAVVLADETLLPLALNALPKKIEGINITMGYPLKDLPSTLLFSLLFKLFLSQESLQKSTTNSFYFKDVIAILKHPLLFKTLSLPDEDLSMAISAQITKTNEVFLSKELIAQYLVPLENDKKEILMSLFKPFTTIEDFFTRLLGLISYLKEEVSAIEKEYLFRFYKIFTQLQQLQSTYNYVQSLKGLFQLFNQLIASETLSFQGEPLKGLQLMGMLETRVLDFENLIISSVNEGVLPAGNKQNSFIPFDVKLEYELPTFKEKDAIFSYHFFRLLQRAKNVYLLYNSESDSFGAGEKSRFITQLSQLKEDLNSIQIAPEVITEKTTLKSIDKSAYVLNKLEELAQKGLSPSSITSYLRNPLDFYQQKILGIKELEVVEETVASNTLGTIVHETLEALYKPFEGCVLHLDNLSSMEPKIDESILFYFKKNFHQKIILTGKNKLIFEVAKLFVKRFIKDEKKLVADGNRLELIATEQNLTASISVKGIDFPIKLHGNVDRIDKLNGVLRIIDYKTGKVLPGDLRTSDFDTIADEKYSKAIQVLLYAFLYSKTPNYNPEESIEAGVISFKNLKDGFMKINFAESRKPADVVISAERLAAFMEAMEQLIFEIYNPEIPFEEKLIKKMTP